MPPPTNGPVMRNARRIGAIRHIDDDVVALGVVVVLRDIGACCSVRNAVPEV